MKFILLTVLILPLLTRAQQDVSDSNYIYWSSERRLTKQDFHIVISNTGNGYSFGQFGCEYSINPVFGWRLPRDYKNKIRGYFIKSASWIDTSYDVNTSLRYQQTLFDLSEVYVRQFRKSVFDNRKQILKGKTGIKKLNSDAMTDFAKRRIQYDTSTNFATKPDMQMHWERVIATELDGLKEFSAN